MMLLFFFFTAEFPFCTFSSQTNLIIFLPVQVLSLQSGSHSLVTLLCLCFFAPYSRAHVSLPLLHMSQFGFCP